MKARSAKTKVQTTDLTELLKPYRSGWVALSSDQQHVVGDGKTLQRAYEKAVEHGVDDPVLVKVIPPDRGYIPLSL